MREGRDWWLRWLVLLLLLGAATQCQGNDQLPGEGLETTTAEVVAPPPLEATATAPPQPPQPTAIPTAVTEPLASDAAPAPQPTLTTPATISTTVAAVATTAAPPPEPSPEPSPTPIIYVVEEGDTLLGIAIDRGTTVEEIVALNPGLQAALLQIGQQIILPAETAAVAPTDIAVDMLPSGVEVVGVGWYENPAGGWWVLGEVVNGSEQAIESVQVAVDFLDASGNVLVSHQVWTANSIIVGGGRSPFGTLLVEAPSEFDRAAARVAGGNRMNSLGSRYLDLSVTETEVETAEEADTALLRLTGEVVNQGAAVASGVVVVITVYGDEGNVTGYVLHELEGEIAPAAATSFAIDIVPPGGTITEYAITVQGIITTP